MTAAHNRTCRNLVLVLGDQLNHDAAVFDSFDPQRDAIWMAEVPSEAAHVWSSKQRIAMFLAAMRHYRDESLQRGRTVHYHPLEEADATDCFESVLTRSATALKPERLRVVKPGAWRVEQLLVDTASRLRIPLDILEDRHFLSSPDEFAQHAHGRKQLRMEFFYREMRRRHNVLMDGDQPVGGEWNFDKSNRQAFGKDGPPLSPPVTRFRPHDTTQAVIDLVNDRFADHPGKLDTFIWPVTRGEALRAKRQFMRHSLPSFGDFQDAMWTDRPILFHSRLSAALNLKLLNPREVIADAEQAYRRGDAPLNAVEGFIRQILGWREYVRGVYWLHMPDYINRNALRAQRDLPDFYWTGDTDMRCLSQAIGQTLELGYAHHIQRLMVTGLFALLYGVHPRHVHAWYLAVYVDAVEWVELPNTLGMSQFGDGGIMASKPYCASGKYIDRMSNYCKGCRYDPSQATGETACPFTTLYWDFLDRHQGTFAQQPRMKMQIKNLERKRDDEIIAVRNQAKRLFKQFGSRAEQREGAE